MLRELVAAVPPDVRVGVTDLAGFDDARDAIEARVSSGLNGGLGFVYASPEESTNPARTFPWGRSIVVAAVPYLRDGDGEVDASSDSAGVVRSVARFADGDRYLAVRDTLGALQSVIEAAGGRCEHVFDDDRLVDRAVAVRAGVAWPGKSTMAINPTAGPWFLIGSVVTDIEIEPTEPMSRGCGTCDACIPACPTGAIVGPGVLDARRCLAAVLQRPGPIPEELREAVGGRIYGCDDCLSACPPGTKVLGVLSPSTTQPTPRSVLERTDDELATMSRHWYVPKRNVRFVRRNALVALGNTGNEADLPFLAGYLGHPDPLLQSHASWAIETIGGETAEAILDFERQLSEESRSRVDA